MTNHIEVTAVDKDMTCDELRDALARQQSLLVDETDAKALIGGATVGGDLLPGSTNEGPNNTVIEAEIQRLQQAMAEKGCES